MRYFTAFLTLISDPELIALENGEKAEIRSLFGLNRRLGGSYSGRLL